MRGEQVICVREHHLRGAEAVNDLVMFPADGSAPPRSIAGGHDFTSSPRVSPDGTRLAWLTWDHPNMPWDATELWVAALTPDGTLDDPERIAGGQDESIFQPEWSPDGRLHFISDRTNWWNLYRLEAAGDVTAAHADGSRFGAPQWLFGFRRYGFLDSGAVVALYEQHGISTLGILEDGEWHPRKLARDIISPTLAIGAGRVWTVAAGVAEPAAVVGIDPGSGDQQVIRSSISIDLDEAFLSQPHPIEFPTTGGALAYAFYYPPTSADFVAPG